MVLTLLFALVAGLNIGPGSPQPRALPGPPPTVLFVCEHGGAKSVIAAAHFNQIAKQRGLPYRAVARGTAPDPAVPAGVRQGLEKAGLEITVEKPVLVGQSDVDKASRVVTFDVALPGAIASTKPPTGWNATPSVSCDFDVASAEIKRRVELLIDELTRK